MPLTECLPRTPFKSRTILYTVDYLFLFPELNVDINSCKIDEQINL